MGTLYMKINESISSPEITINRYLFGDGEMRCTIQENHSFPFLSDFDHSF